MADVFRGNNLTRVDEKNRLKIPVDFKRLVDEKCGPTAKFFITSTDGKRAQLYPIKEWELKEAKLATLPSSHPIRLKYQSLTAYYGSEAEMDNQGRLLLPSPVRETASLTGEVVVLGMAGTLEPGYLEVANHDLFKAEMKAAPLTQEDLAALAALGL
jgi:MraZ protein